MLKHLVCIMDGNRRWAHENKTSLSRAYQEGIKAIERVVSVCNSEQIPYLTLYAFSLENAQRSSIETHFLCTAIMQQEKNLLQYCKEQNIQLHVSGDKAQIPATLYHILERIERQTQSCNGLFLQILFYYGGRQEVVHAVNAIIQKVIAGDVTLPITDELIRQHGWSKHIPDPDVIIRTGGHKRLSNCLTFQSVYSELYFSDTLWPDISTHEIRNACLAFSTVQRNFGL